MKTGIPIIDDMDDRDLVESMAESTVLAAAHKQFAQEVFTFVQMAMSAKGLPPVEMRRAEMAAVVRIARSLGLPDRSLLIQEGIV